jgi:hypothetical protein
LGLTILVLVATATAVGWQRFRTVGPGPDLGTTVDWMLHGDGQRRPTLATLMRGYETSRAVMRFCIDNGEPCSFDEKEWPEIARYSNALWRGFVPLVQWAASSSSIVGRLADLLAVDGKDGWGEAWKATIVPLPVGTSPEDFYPGALRSGSPPPDGRALWRLDLVSAGSDRLPGTADDLRFEAVFPAPRPIRLGDPAFHREREVELERGQVWVRWSGTELDLVDGRALAEFYLESTTPD